MNLRASSQSPHLRRRDGSMRVRPRPMLAPAALAVLACTPIVAPSADTPNRDATSDSLDDTTADRDPPTSDGPVDDTAADSTTGAPWDFTCSSFDPTRVYLYGTLAEGLGYLDALVDPTTPTEFCVGFGESSGSQPRVHPFDHHVEFIGGDYPAAVLEFVSDPFAWMPDGNPDYPDDPFANDPVVLSSPCDARSALWYLRLSPIDGRPYTSCTGAWFDSDSVPIAITELARDIAIAPDGRLVAQEPAALVIVRPGDPEPTLLATPRAGATVVAGRVHDDGLWLAAVEGARVFRWFLSGDVIVEEGEYAEPSTGPAYLATEAGVIDGGGDFVHFAQGVDEGFNDAIVTRPLAPGTAEIIYREDELPALAVKIHASVLFTGP